MYKRVAVLLAGGKGTRLKPYTTNIPKPLVSVGLYPIAEIVVRQLRKNGFTDVFFAVNHMADIIRDRLGDGSRFGIQFRYFKESIPLGTMGPLYLMRHDLPEDFIVMNGDVLTDLPFSDLLDYHARSHHLFTIASTQRIHTIDYGILHVNDENILTGFEEKPNLPYAVSMGVYAVNKKILEHIPPNEFFGFDHLMLSLLSKRHSVNVYPYGGYWNDIGRPSDYIRALEDLQSLEGTFL